MIPLIDVSLVLLIFFMMTAAVEWGCSRPSTNAASASVPQCSKWIWYAGKDGDHHHCGPALRTR